MRLVSFSQAPYQELHLDFLWLLVQQLCSTSAMGYAV